MTGAMNYFQRVAAALFNLPTGAQGAGAASIRAENAVTTGLSIEELVRMLDGGMMESFAGRAVNEQSALAVSAVFACVSLIGGSVATCPAKIYERGDGGEPKEVEAHPYWYLLNERPCAAMSAAVYWEYLVSSALMLGDGFAELKRRDYRTNEIASIVPHHKSRVQVYLANDGALLYRVTPDKGPQYVVTSADMLHVPGPGFDGKNGMSLIQWAARQAIGTALAAEEYSARFFGNGAKPGGVLQTDAAKLSPEAVDVLRNTWMAKHGGTARSHLPAVLTGGLKWQQIEMNAEDAQLIATRGFQVEDICRFFGVPPHMIGHMDKVSSWGTGVEQIGRGFVKFTLSRLLVKMQQEINAKFWPLREKYFVAFDVAGLERGDLKSENESFRIALGRAGEPGWMTVDEVRKLKNLEPMGGDAGKLRVTDAKTSGNEKGEKNEKSNPATAD